VRLARHTLLASLACIASACNVGPDYQRPEVASPPAFRDEGPVVEPASIADLPWWEVFKDRTLQDLVRTALINNYDLRITIARIEQARALAGQAHALYLPRVDYQAGIGGGKNEILGAAGPNGGQTQASGIATVNASWELDLWGRISRSNESAQAELLFAEENRRGVLLSLVSDVAQAYFELLELDLELEIAHRNTEAFSESARLFSRRYSGGIGSKLDVSRAEADMATTAAQIPELERQISVKENQICVLLAIPPRPIERSTTLLEQEMPPHAPPGVPSALLERRPDIRAAEALMRSANAQVGVANADYFPRVSLTGFLGVVSPDVGNITGGSTGAWGLGANALGPLFEGGALDARLEQAKAQWEEARLQYQRIVLLAFRDVANALVARQRLVLVREQQERAVVANMESVKLARERYDAGKASYFEVLQAQQLLFPAENALAQTQLGERLAVVALYQALGGGWQLPDDQWSGTDPVVTAEQASAEQPAEH
jgi:multidrug efflux system outer membrane protein